MTSASISPAGSEAPIVVELAGTPGCGKTTAAASVREALRLSGWAPLHPEADARRVAARTRVGRLVQRLPVARLREAILWRTYLIYRLLGAGREILSRPRHFAWLVRHQRHRPEGARARRRRVLHWYLRMAGAQRFYRAHLESKEAVVFDEGHFHRVVQLFSSPEDRGSPADIARYLEEAPPPDVILHVDAAPEVCLERIERRGVWPRLGDLDRTGLERFVVNADETVRLTVDRAREAGWKVNRIDNSGDMRSLDAAVVETIHSNLENRPLPVRRDLSGIVIPRPRQVAVLVGGRLRSPQLDPTTIDRFLAELGTERKGQIANLPLGRRSSSVRVSTGLGRLVVREYPSHWPDESLLHEHAVLRHLAAVGFPSTRLVVFPTGATVQHADGRRIAAYRFVAGRNISGSYLTRRMRREAHRVAGHLLAELHRATSGLEISHRHHLAMIDPAGRLSSQLTLLDDLSATPGPARDLADRTGELAERLVRLHSTLTDAAPSVAVIHGDYGLHNLLIRPDGSAVVVDFELARRDWCLVDLVEALGVMSGVDGDEFLAGYADAVGGEPAEWKLLPTMWEYHRLTGAIRAWQSYVNRADAERLGVARKRLSEADRVAEEGVPAWT